MSLNRFKTTQLSDYPIALAEIKHGRKRSHWMWYIFPQIAGLGMTDISRRYAITGINEARDYLADKLLRTRLEEISRALLQLDTNNAHEVFGSPDDMKLRSSMTLFGAVPGASPVFGQVLEKFYAGEKDKRTLDLLNK